MTVFSSVRFRIGALLGALALFSVVPASATTTTANLSVTATVVANCTISTTALAFGSYDPVSTHSSSPLEATGGVVVTCTSGASTAVTLGQGSNPNSGSSDTVPLRRMSDGGTNRLSYTLYQDMGRNTVWGNTAGTSVAHTGTGTATTLTVFGRVAGAQNVPAGSYSDTVVATITF